MNAEKKKKLFSDFIRDARIMIVDRSPRTRSRLIKSLVDLGAKSIRIQSVAHLEEAMALAQTHKPHLILSDYAIRGGSGFDLFKGIRDDVPELKNTILVLITSNISQTAVAKAAEEDVDAFIIKPYTIETFDRSLQNATIAKLYPSEYVQTVEEGKKLLFQGEYEKALSLFERAFSLNKKPSLAYFYHGQAKYMMKENKNAIGDYNKGLEFNAIHYKCQIGLYELFVKEEKFQKAYDVVKNITKYFPANPKRLKEVIRLSIRTGNYKDLDYYYDVFLDLDEREDEVVNYICSGMFILGKYYLEYAREEEMALEVFEKVGVSSAGGPKFLQGIIKLLVRYHMGDEALKYLNRFASEDKESNAYKLSSLIVESAKGSIESQSKLALEAYNSGVRDFEMFKILVKSLLAKGLDDQAQKYKQEAEDLYPERKIKIKKKKVSKAKAA